MSVIVQHRPRISLPSMQPAAPVANPSHTGLDDLEREYGAAIRARLVLYHYADEPAAAQLREGGYTVATPGAVYPLPPPNDDALASTWSAWSSA